MASRRSRTLTRAWNRPWLRRLAKFAAVLVLAPVVLTILYLPPFVHPVSTLMMRDLVTLRGFDRQWVPLEDVAPVLVHSVVMSEDGQFCSHRGIDWGELRAEFNDFIAGKPIRGE